MGGVITSALRSLRCKSPALLSSLRRLEQIRRPAQGDAHQNCRSRSDCRLSGQFAPKLPKSRYTSRTPSFSQLGEPFGD
jgi:hypothetical protein